MRPWVAFTELPLDQARWHAREPPRSGLGDEDYAAVGGRARIPTPV